jgi:hypothetical protein
MAPTTKKSIFDLPTGPDHIVLYQKNIEAVCSSEDEVCEQIRLTVIHELGHYFGLDENQLKLGGKCKVWFASTSGSSLKKYSMASCGIPELDNSVCILHIGIASFRTSDGLRSLHLECESFR